MSSEYINKEKAFQREDLVNKQALRKPIKNIKAVALRKQRLFMMSLHGRRTKQK
jgi:hypothetical protein